MMKNNKNDINDGKNDGFNKSFSPNILYRSTISNPSAKSLVIQAYLNGKSRDQISKETGISAGKTSNIIADWKKGIKTSNIDELREFAVTIKKSRLTIEQCARGYKIAKLMDSLGIVDDEYNHDMEGDYNTTSSTSHEKRYIF